jgi:hypothetical protein
MAFFKKAIQSTLSACYNPTMRTREQKNVADAMLDQRTYDEPLTPPKFKSTKSKSPREIFYLAIALASFIRLAMHFIQR